jgi:mRNA-degrading endonuclease toxin of MazEF toxin-antitoxin module
MARSYVPDAGDIVWISFSPQAGHGQAGHRPAVVLSPAAYNAKTSLMVCWPYDDTDQELSVRGACYRRQSERGAGGSGEESRLAEETGSAQRDNIAGRAVGSAGQNPPVDRLNVMSAFLAAT